MDPPNPPPAPLAEKNSDAAVTEELLPRRKPVPQRTPTGFTTQEASRFSFSPSAFFSSPSLFVVILYTFAAFGVFVWIAVRLALQRTSWTSSSVIGAGGSFTQPQAKIVDFFCSTVIAPLIMALFNVCVFRVARRCVITAKTGEKESVSLAILVEVGGTDWGTYSPVKFISLLKTAQWRVVLLGLTAVMCAIASSALTNVVAYQSTNWKHVVDGDSTELAYLYAPPLNTGRDATGGGGRIFPSIDTKGSARFTSEWFAALTSLSYATAEDQGLLDDDGSFVGINATDASINMLPLATTDLYYVPAYKLTYECKLRTPSQPNLVVMGGPDRAMVVGLGIKSLLNESDPMLRIHQARVENGRASVLSTYSGDYDFVSFDFGGETMFLGTVGTFNSENFTTITPFGNLTHVPFNNTLLPLDGQSGLGTKAILSMWGLGCVFYHQEGTVSLHRSINSTGWARARKNDKFVSQKEVLPLILPDLQLLPPYVSPVSNSHFPGIGGALAASVPKTQNPGVSPSNPRPSDYADYRAFVRNTLYAEGQARRIAYEASLSNASVPVTTYKLKAESTETRYQMTFVPWILAMGLLALFNAGVMALRLAVSDGGFGMKSRLVTPLRVVVDAGAGLSKEFFEQADSLPKAKDVDAFGARTRVRYVREDEDGLGVNNAVRLRAA